MEMCVNQWVNNTGGGEGSWLVCAPNTSAFFLLFWSTKAVFIVNAPMMTRDGDCKWWPFRETKGARWECKQAKLPLSLLFAYTNTPVRSALNPKPFESAERGRLRSNTEKPAAEPFSSSTLSPRSVLCLQRGVLLKGLPCSEKQKKKKTHQRYNHWDDILKVSYPWCSTHLQLPPPAPPVFLMMYHIRDLSEIGLKMTYWAYLADNIKGYGNGYLSFHQRAFQTF